MEYPTYQVYYLEEKDFDNVIELGGKINGENYLNHDTLRKVLRKSRSKDVCCSRVLYELSSKELVGFRLTYAPGKWEPDKWCSVDKWGIPASEICYFKANMIDKDHRGAGLGSWLLALSISDTAKQGAKAGVTHIWSQSPENSAYNYFVKAGGQVIKNHPSRWNEDCKNDGYICVYCGNDCHCDGIEMILYF